MAFHPVESKGVLREIQLTKGFCSDLIIQRYAADKYLACQTIGQVISHPANQFNKIDTLCPGWKV